MCANVSNNIQAVGVTYRDVDAYNNLIKVMLQVSLVGISLSIDKSTCPRMPDPSMSMRNDKSLSFYVVVPLHTILVYDDPAGRGHNRHSLNLNRLL